MKLLLFVLTLGFSTLTSAQNCSQIIRAEADRINEERGYTTNVGGQFYVNPLSGQLGYYPGIPVAARIDNWARDLNDAILWGPYSFTSGIDEREVILNGFSKSIKRDCKLPDDDYRTLRFMLRELFDEGAFCKDNTFLDRPFLRPWKNYHRALVDAVKSGRFSEECAGPSTVSSPDRTSKEVAPASVAPATPSAVGQ